MIKDDRLNTEWYDCICSDSEHCVRFMYDPDDVEEFYLEVHLSKRSIWKRLVYAWRYLWGRQSRYGAFHCWTLHASDADRLATLLDRLRKAHAEE